MKLCSALSISWKTITCSPCLTGHADLKLLVSAGLTLPSMSLAKPQDMSDLTRCTKSMQPSWGAGFCCRFSMQNSFNAAFLLHSMCLYPQDIEVLFIYLVCVSIYLMPNALTQLRNFPVIIWNHQMHDHSKTPTPPFAASGSSLTPSIPISHSTTPAPRIWRSMLRMLWESGMCLSMFSGTS